LAILVPPPGLFSITTCCPHSFDNPLPSTRASVSVGPPAASGTIKRTDRLGQALDWPRAEIFGASVEAAESAIKRRRVSMATPRLKQQA
jgi:hypothetical protein